MCVLRGLASIVVFEIVILDLVLSASASPDSMDTKVRMSQTSTQLGTAYLYAILELLLEIRKQLPDDLADIGHSCRFVCFRDCVVIRLDNRFEQETRGLVTSARCFWTGSIAYSCVLVEDF